MTHAQLIEHGCKFEVRFVDSKKVSGYWLDGVYLGNTPKIATEAIRG